MMKRHVIRSAVLCTVILLLALSATASAEVKVFVTNVGKGDAILVMADSYTCLIDTGKKSAKDAVEAAFDRFGIEYLDAIFLTHSDSDHAGGLKWLKKFPVDAVYASEYSADYAREDHPATKFADKQDLEVIWLGAGDTVALGDSGAEFRVLAPLSANEENEDDDSLVMMLVSPDGKMLMTGDMEYDESVELLDTDADLHCDVLKVPNHGDSDACPYELAEACGAKIAVISTDSSQKPGTPSARVVSDLENVGSQVMVTQDTGAGILVTMDDGKITARGIDE